VIGQQKEVPRITAREMCPSCLFSGASDAVEVFDSSVRERNTGTYFRVFPRSAFVDGIYGSVRTARGNLARYSEARAVLNQIGKRVSRWTTIADAELGSMIPPPEVPRAFNTSFEGCPVHGAELFKFGNYSWIMDPFKRPWKLECPVGGEEYPSNDFMSYLDSGLQDRSLLTGDYPDDGWGWRKKGDPKKHWFVAYYCHWLWYSHIIPAVLDLSRAFLLTRKDVYGRKCLVMLHRIAQYYPDMDHNKQSRYATEFAPSYQGKIVNYIWETNVIRHLAESVANLRPYITHDRARIVGMRHDELIRFLEDRLLLEGIAGIHGGKIVGNYGMHQNAMLVILKALAREEETKRELDQLLNNPAGGYWHQGLRYALDNYIYREGMSFENAPGYCFTWSSNLISIAQHLDSLGMKFPDIDKLRNMLEAPDRLVCLGKFTPAIGDSGSVTSGRARLSPGDAAKAYRMFRSPSFAKHTKPGFTSYEDLFLPPLSENEIGQASKRYSLGRRSDCLGGYGLVILRAKRLECSMFFGRMNGHGHFDRLGIELFGLGQRVMPDLGYPQFAAESKSPPAWERNTISHNTVTVNERRQDTGSAGWLGMFHCSRLVQVAEASAPRTYQDAPMYKRTVALIGREHPFLLDIFRVTGGRAHDYSVHGLDGKFRTHGIVLSGRPGTLAGGDVPYGYLYDDPELETPDKARSYYSYRGSGYSYLYDARGGTPTGPWWAEWGSPKATLRLLFPAASQEAVVAKGNPPLRPGNPRCLTYVMLRNRGEALASTFASVGEVYAGKGRIRSARQVKMRCNKGSAFPVGILVHEEGARHIVFSSLDPEARMEAMGISFCGRFLVVTMSGRGGPSKVFMNGAAVSCKELGIDLGAPVDGRVLKVDYGTSSILLATEGSKPVPSGITGEIAFISNDRRSSCFRVRNARTVPEGTWIELESNGRIGRLIAERVGDREVKTETELMIAGHGYYEGARLVDRGLRRSLVIESVERGVIRLAEPLGDFALPEAYVWEFGPGDRVLVGSHITLEKVGTRWNGITNASARVRIGGKEREVGPGRFIVQSARSRL